MQDITLTPTTISHLVSVALARGGRNDSPVLQQIELSVHRGMVHATATNGKVLLTVPLCEAGSEYREGESVTIPYEAVQALKGLGGKRGATLVLEDDERWSVASASGTATGKLEYGTYPAWRSAMHSDEAPTPTTVFGIAPAMLAIVAKAMGKHPITVTHHGVGRGLTFEAIHKDLCPITGLIMPVTLPN